MFAGKHPGATDQLVKVVGDALVGAAFQYMRGLRYQLLLKKWSASVVNNGIPMSADFSLVNFLSKPVYVQQWQIDGLPKDDFSVENGVISTSGNRWPLMIDPQGQANKWVRTWKGKNFV